MHELGTTTEVTPTASKEFLKKILIADDNPDILGLLGRILESMGYIVLSARDGEEALDIFHVDNPHLVILDVMMPKKNGWETLQAIRLKSQVPVIMLTALCSPDDHVKGFAYGADDYIPKPFANRVLKARIKAVMKHQALPIAKSSMTNTQTSARAPLVEIDDSRKQVRIRGERYRLTHKEYQLISLLASDPGRVFSPQEIIDQLWPHNSGMTTVDVHQRIYLLRRRVEQQPKKPQIILTIRGFGYRICDQLINVSS